MRAPDPVVRREAVGPGYRVREIHYAAGYRQEPHAHDSDGITLVLSGSLRETVAGRDETASPLSVVVKPAGVVHADEMGPRTVRTIQVLLQTDRFLPRRRVDLGSWRWLHGGPGAREILFLHRILWRAERGDDPRFEEGILDLLGTIVAENAPARAAPAWLRRAKEALDDRLATGFRVRDLAAEVGVHPVSLTRAFRRHYGATVSAYRRRERLRRAAAAFEGSSRDLTRIAHESGYVDHPHMCREIREATGLTPSELRAIARRS